MSKEVQMTFRVEPELRAEFSDAALLEDRPAAQCCANSCGPMSTNRASAATARPTM
jgi:hypothetical protein